MSPGRQVSCAEKIRIGDATVCWLPAKFRLKLELLAVLTALANLSGESQSGTVPARGSDASAANSVVRVKTGNTIAEFSSRRAALVLKGHPLIVDFPGAAGVSPKLQPISGPPGVTVVKVRYDNLWPGISLTYSISPKEDCDAIFTIAPGANVAQIRLRYGAPVQLRKDGTLVIESTSGPIIESSPEAWQQLGGRRVAIPVTFTLDGNQVGFALGDYDHGFAVTIDPVYLLRWNSARQHSIHPSPRSLPARAFAGKECYA